MTLPSAPSPARLLAQLKTRLGEFVVEGWQGRSGDELYQAIARVFSHLSLRVRFDLLSAYLRRARGAARHRVDVILTWSEVTNWGYTIKAGQLLVQTAWGAKYRLIEDLVRAADAPAGSVTITVEAEWAGFEYFVAPGTICQFIYPVTVDPAASILWSDDTSESGMDRFLLSIGGPPVGKFVDTPTTAVTLTVTNPDSGLVGPLGLPAIGATGFLDLLAIERGLPREDGESDDALRVRIRTLPDVVTPGAILRVMNVAFHALFAAVWPGEVPTDEVVTLWEPWNYGYAPGVGAIGVHPVARSHSFMVIIPSVPWLGIGYAPGVGAIGVHPIGTADMARSGYYAGLQNQLDRIRAGGIWGQIYEGEAPAPPAEPVPLMLSYWHLPPTSAAEPELNGIGEPDAAYTAFAEQLVLGSALIFWMRVIAASVGGGFVVQVRQGAEPAAGVPTAFALHVAAGSAWVARLSVNNYLMADEGTSSSDFAFDEWCFYSIETDSGTGAARLYRNAVLIVTTSGAAPEPGGEGAAPCEVRFSSGGANNTIDFTNVMPLGRALTSDERTALTAAGPDHDFTEAFDDGAGHVWAGGAVTYCWPNGALINQGTEGTPTMVLSGAATVNEEPL